MKNRTGLSESNIMDPFKKKLILIILFIFLLNLPGAETTLRICRVSIYSLGSGQSVSLQVEIADTPESREQGLMHRQSLKKNSGMMFIFEKDEYLSFWMQNTYIPLDIAYIDRNGIIGEIYQMSPLDSTSIIRSAKPFRYALEVNRGWFRAHKIHKGSKIDLNGCFR